MAEVASPSLLPRLVGRRTPGPLAPALSGIVFALIVLAAVSLAISPGTLRGSALLSTLPFAALLAIAAIGQTAVVQHGGLDLSLAGTISLCAAIVTKGSHDLSGGLAAAFALAAAAAIAIGVLNGLLVARAGITPLIATLGVNALIVGVVLQLTGGVPTAAPDGLTSFALDRTLGVPNTVLVAVALAAAVGGLRFTVLGRRHVAVGLNVSAARHAGVRVTLHRVAPYVFAALCYALAATLIAGFQQSPGVSVGDSYLVPAIAVVVLAGTSLTGGRASVAATLLAAVFLTQLNQLVLSVGAPTAVQYLIQGGVIAVGVACRELPVVQRLVHRLRRSQ